MSTYFPVVKKRSDHYFTSDQCLLRGAENVTISYVTRSKDITKQTGLIAKNKISQRLRCTAGPCGCTKTVKPCSPLGMHKMALSNIVIFQYAPISFIMFLLQQTVRYPL